MTTVKPSKAGNTIRAIADKLKAQNEQDKKALIKILSNVAQITTNYENLITEVSEMCQEDIEK